MWRSTMPRGSPTELLPDEKKAPLTSWAARSTGLPATASPSSASYGSAYRSHARKRLVRLAIKHIRTPPYTPRSNGKAEHFVQTSFTRVDLRPPVSLIDRARPCNPGSPPLTTPDHAQPSAENLPP
jgi:hypothetical protein